MTKPKNIIQTKNFFGIIRDFHIMNQENIMQHFNGFNKAKFYKLLSVLNKRQKSTLKVMIHEIIKELLNKIYSNIKKHLKGQFKN